MLSGLVLIDAILKIKRFYSSSDNADQLNTKSLLLHSSAFGVYLFTEILGCVSFALYEIDEDQFDTFNDVMGIIWFALSVTA